jgi:hypothetical protein
MEHPEFRRRLLEDPRQALTDHGFALEPGDLSEIERIRQDLSTNDDAEQRLVTIAEQYGVKPRT